MENNSPTCRDCCHLEVCVYATHDLPICDCFKEDITIVRCKDCIYNNSITNNCYCSEYNYYPNPYDFCSRGVYKNERERL